MILVVYSERGLVVKGSTNLELFNILYWTVFVTYIVLFFFLYSPALGGKDTEDICLKTSMFSAKQKHIVYVFISLDWIVIILLERFKLKSIRRQCANMKRFSALGGTRRRNMFTGLETNKYLYFIFSSLCFQELFYKEGGLFERETAAILYNLFWIVILVLYLAIFLPIQHLAKSFQRFPEFWLKCQEKEITDFYVRKYVPKPRRDINKTNLAENTLKNDAGCSYDTAEQIGGKGSNCMRKIRDYKGHLPTVIEMPEIDI